MKRVLTALLAGSVAIGAVLLLDSRAVFWMALALLVGCAVEYNALGRRLYPDLPRPLLLLAVPLVAASWLLPAPAPPAPLPFLLLAAAPLLFALLLMPTAAPAAAVGAVGWLSFGLPYLVLPVWSFYELHRLDPGLLVVLLLAVWGNDSVAFLVGSRWGRRKLAPKLSPNKTWEGALGGLVGGGLISAAGLWRIDLEPSWPVLGIFMVAMVSAQAGDLVESMLKRAAQVKDSGWVVPGHGGLLDRLDAIILAAPVFYGLLVATGLGAGLPG